MRIVYGCQLIFFDFLSPEAFRAERGFVMKKIIGGKVYNTDTAKEISSRTVYSDGNTVGWIALYVSPKGTYFLVSDFVPRALFFSDSFDLLSKKAAQEWVEEFGSADEYEAEWGSPEVG